MALVTALSKELSNRMDCVEADFERLIESGANREALERIVKHSLEIGIIKDKLENIKIHDLLEGDDESNEQTNIGDRTGQQDDRPGSTSSKIPA